MQLYFICSPVSGNGGIETVLSDVINHLNTDYNITLLLTNNPKNKEWLSSISKTVRIYYPQKEKHTSTFLIYQLFKIKNKDKVIILGANILKYAYYLRKIFFKKWPIVSWIHFSLKHQSMFNPQNLLYADYHLAISSKIKQELMEMGIPQNNIYLIYNPISSQNLTITSNMNRTLKLVFIGHITLDGQKNLHELFDGIKSYQKKYGQIQVDLFGSMDEVNKCKDYASKLEISKSLIWHNWTSNPWENIYKKIKPNALILTSKFEGLPMVVLEAMSYGLPCITSNFDGFNDIIQEGINGLSYPQGNITALVNKLHLLKSITFNPQKIKASIAPYYSNNYYRRLLFSIKDIIDRT